MPRKPEVVSHWHQLYENFSTSSGDFYAAVEAAITKRKVPDLKFSRVTWKESGILSPKREYLRVARGRLHWDICAAPFGTGFFFSSRLALLPRRLAGLIYLFLFVVICFVTLNRFEVYVDYSLFFPFRMWIRLKHDVPIVAALFFSLGACVRMGAFGDEDAVLAMPIVGFLYEKVFNPDTYYKEDTDLMFKEAVQSSMLEAVNDVTSGKSIRVVSGAAENERGGAWSAAEPLVG